MKGSARGPMPARSFQSLICALGLLAIAAVSPVTIQTGAAAPPMPPGYGYNYDDFIPQPFGPPGAPADPGEVLAGSLNWRIAPARSYLDPVLTDMPDSANIDLRLDLFQEILGDYGNDFDRGTTGVPLRGELQFSPNMDQPLNAKTDLTGTVVSRSDAREIVGFHSLNEPNMADGVSALILANAIAQAAYVVHDPGNGYVDDLFVLPVNMEFNALGVQPDPYSEVPAYGSEQEWSRYTSIQSCPPTTPADCRLDIPDGGAGRNLMNIGIPLLQNDVSLNTDGYYVEFNWTQGDIGSAPQPALWGEISYGQSPIPSPPPNPGPQFIDVGNNANAVKFQVRSGSGAGAEFRDRAQDCDPMYSTTREPERTYYDLEWSKNIFLKDLRNQPDATELRLDAFTWDYTSLGTAITVSDPNDTQDDEAEFTVSIPAGTFTPVPLFNPTDGTPTRRSTEIILNGNTATGGGGSKDCAIRLEYSPIDVAFTECPPAGMMYEVPADLTSFMDLGTLFRGRVRYDSRIPIEAAFTYGAGYHFNQMLINQASQTTYLNPANPFAPNENGIKLLRGSLQVRDLPEGIHAIEIKIAVEDHPSFTASCIINIHALPIEPPGFLNCDGSITFTGRRWVPLSPQPFLWAAYEPDMINGSFDFRITAATLNDEPLPGILPLKDRLEAEGIWYNETVDYPHVTDSKRMQFRATPRHAGFYNITVEAYSTTSYTALDICTLILVIRPAPAPVFSHPSPCSYLNQEFKIDMIHGLPARIPLHAYTPLPTEEGMIRDYHGIDIRIDLDQSSGDGSAEGISGMGWGKAIEAKLDYTAPGTGHHVYEFVATNDDGNSTKCRVGFNAMDMTWTASTQVGTTTTPGTTTFVVGNDRGGCVSSELEPRISSNGRAVFKIMTEDMDGTGPYTLDVRDLMEPRALAAAAPNGASVVLAGGGYTSVNADGDCVMVPVGTVLRLTEGSWFTMGTLEEGRLSPVLLSKDADRVLAGGDRAPKLVPYPRPMMPVNSGFHTPTATLEEIGGGWKTLTENKVDGTIGLRTMPAGLAGSAHLNRGDTELVTGGTGHPQVPVGLVQHYDLGTKTFTDPMVPYESAAGVALSCSPAEVFLVGGTQGRRALWELHAADNYLYDAARSTKAIYRSSDGGVTWDAKFGDLTVATSYMAGDVSPETGLALVHGGYTEDVFGEDFPLNTMYGLDCNTLATNGAFTPQPAVAAVTGLAPTAAEHAAAFIRNGFYIAGGVQPRVECMPGSHSQEVKSLLSGPGPTCPSPAPAIKCQVSNHVAKYDPITKIWTPHDEIPTELPGIASMGYARDLKWGFLAMAGGRTVQGTGCYEPVKESRLYYPLPTGVGPVAAVENLLKSGGITPPGLAQQVVDAANWCTTMTMEVGQGGLWFRLDDLPTGLISPSVEWWNHNADLYVFGGDETGKDRGNSVTIDGGPMDMRPSRAVYVQRNAIPTMLADMVQDAENCYGLNLPTNPFTPGWIKWDLAHPMPLPVVAAPSIHADGCIYILGGHHAPLTSARLVQIYKLDANAEEVDLACDGTPFLGATGDRQQRQLRLMQNDPLHPGVAIGAPQAEWWMTEHHSPRAHHGLTRQLGGSPAKTIVFGGATDHLYGDGGGSTEWRVNDAYRGVDRWGNGPFAPWGPCIDSSSGKAFPITVDTVSPPGTSMQIIATGGVGVHRSGDADQITFGFPPC